MTGVPPCLARALSAILLVLAFSGCRATPAPGAPRVRVAVDSRGTATFVRSHYPPEAVIHVPGGTRLVGLRPGGRGPLAEIRRRLYERKLSAGSVHEFWVWIRPELALAGFDRESFDYDLGDPDDRRQVLARAYGLE